MSKIKLNQEEIKNIEVFLQNRFRELDDMRSEFDDLIEEEINIYNDKDKYMEEKAEWEEKITVPYIYTIVQTIVARLIESFFSTDNYIKVFPEDDSLFDQEDRIRHWIQNKLDGLKFKYRARDFFEDSLIQRTIWLALRPVMDEKDEFKQVDFDVIKWFDFWFDTTAKDVEDTDIFVRKIIKTSKLEVKVGGQNVYFNTDRVLKDTSIPDDIRDKKRKEYEAKHNVSKYYDVVNLSPTQKVELLEWYGEYKIDGEYKNVIFTIANRKILVRAETNDLKTDKKKLFFPIRPIQQANSLIGKSIPQLIKKQQYELNEIRSLRMQNLKTQVKLLFKYKKNAGIDFDELFAKGGNAIAYEDLPTDIDLFVVPNMVQITSYISSELIQDMQQVTGAVDYLMGTSAARGATETASGIRQITEQALFKFGMMAKNLSGDILDFIKYVIILTLKYNSKNELLNNTDIASFLKQSEKEIEYNYKFDLSISDLSMRRDVERAQFINAINIIGGLMAQTGGNMKNLLREVMKKLKMENIEKILEAPQAEGGGILESMNQQRGGSAQISPQANGGAVPEEEALQGL